MSLFSWLGGDSSREEPTGATPPPPVSTELEAGGLFPMPCVGESFHRGNFIRVCGQPNEEGEDRVLTAHLVLEDENPYDRNSVRVDINGLPVAHLSRDAAVHYRRMLERTGRGRVTCTCKAHISAGWARGRKRVTTQ